MAIWSWDIFENPPDQFWQPDKAPGGAVDPGQSMNFLLLQTLAGADVNVINKLLAAGWSCDASTRTGSMGPFWENLNSLSVTKPTH